MILNEKIIFMYAMDCFASPIRHGRFGAPQAPGGGGGFHPPPLSIIFE